MSEARELLKKIAVAHKQGFDAKDSDVMARAEEEALLVCDTYGYPVNSPNLLLASFWPDD